MSLGLLTLLFQSALRVADLRSQVQGLSTGGLTRLRDLECKVQPVRVLPVSDSPSWQRLWVGRDLSFPSFICYYTVSAVLKIETNRPEVWKVAILGPSWLLHVLRAFLFCQLHDRSPWSAWSSWTHVLEYSLKRWSHQLRWWDRRQPQLSCSAQERATARGDKYPANPNPNLYLTLTLTEP